MRKLKLQMQLSLEGFVAGPNGEMDWMEWNWDDQLKQYVDDLHEPVDAIVMGRKMAKDFMPYWAKVAANPDDPQFEFGKKMYYTPKVVFTKTLQKSEWEHTQLAKGDITEEINHLKKQPGKDIIAYGGANFASNLIKYGLIDEYHLLINPSAIGKGMPIFNALEKTLQLKLDTAIPFDCGIVALRYKAQ